MEDIIYWDHEGRAFLYNFFLYAINEESEDSFKESLAKIKKNPNQLKFLLKKHDMKWEDA